MPLKLILGVVILLALGAALWFYRDTEPLRHWLPAELRSMPALPSGGSAAATPAGANPDGLRKCRQGTRLIYTNGECPRGSVEQAISGGAVTVVPAQKPDSALDGNLPAKAAPNLRDLLGKPQEGDLRDKRIEKAVNQ